MTSKRSLVGLALLSALLPRTTSADKPAAADGTSLRFFETKIRPVLVKHCYGCHSAKAGKSEGDLRLDTRTAIRTGGGRGPAVVPGKPEKSWLLTAISHADPDLRMPPKQKKLPASVIADFKAWIKTGAPDPREDAAGTAPKASIKRADRSFWALQPPKPQSVPILSPFAPRKGALSRSERRQWVRRPIDAFILAKLEANQLAPSPDAEPHVFLRRLHFDLVGLPPSPAAVQHFLRRIKSLGVDAAIAKEADELLATPQFGETWGRHWLDVARFGESSGGEANISFPYAWRYRDYVYDAFNADVPFDRFLTEQIAGDLLPYKSDAERARLLIATGYLAVGPKNLDAADAKQFRADVIDEQIDAVTRSVLANSVACARCHDHKFDPFSMQDYYALAGIFSSTKTYFGTAISPSNRIGGDPLRLPDLRGQKVFHRSIPPKRVQQLKAELAALNKEEKDKRAALWKAIREKKDASNIFTLRDALRIFWTRGRIEGELEKVDENGRALPLTMGVLDAKNIHDAPLFDRGDVHKPKDRVARRFPESIALSSDPDAVSVRVASTAIPSDQSGRLQFARWLTHPRHPLTARVIVNRVWSHLLGEGLVRTVDNFGSTGERPSHTQLLDYLAVQFVNNGWSIKRFVREIVLTRTYRQASTFRREAFLKDPDNRLLWRMPKRRLPAEAIRDAMLAASGELDRNRPEASLVGRVIGDRPISLIGLDKRLPRDLDGSTHRSAYLPVIRDRLPDVLDLFDFAEPSLVTGHRETTNVPVQALYLLNSKFVLARSQALAKRLRRETKSPEEFITRAFQLCFSRAPRAEERKRCLRYLNQGTSLDGVAKQRRLTSFCQALLCTAEFRNLD